MKLVALLALLFVHHTAFADLTNLGTWIFDSSGNSLNSTSNALNAYVTNSSLACTQSGTWSVSITNPTALTATLTSVNNSASTFSVLASNSNRKGAIIFNNSSVNCNVAFAATASNSLFSFQLTGSATYVMTAPIYQGTISAICASASGTLQVTEL